MSEAASQSRTLAIILAAGEGTRMKSAIPKVLHPLAGLPLLGHVLRAVDQAGVTDVAVVVGPGRADVAKFVTQTLARAFLVEQVERKGTAHAALQARDILMRGYDSVVVMFGDTPLIKPGTVQRLAKTVGQGAAVAALGFNAVNPFGYGRFLMKDDQLIAIREHKDASEAERAIRLCNGGMMALSGVEALRILDGIGNENIQREYYLPDAVEVARGLGLSAVALLTDEEEILGINDRLQLAGAEQLLQRRLRQSAMLAGVTLIDPETVYLSYDTALEPDVVIEPNVFFGPGVTIGHGSHIKAFCHIEGATVAENCVLGPFLRLRQGSDLAAKAKVGNFVEIKNARIDEGAKISHLSYIGDAHVGAEANIGAGTITCNYDGYNKAHTEIGAGAFIGSNSALVAPVTVGAGAIIGAGSVITEDVPADALAVARGRQSIRAEWAATFRAEASAKKQQRP